MPEFDYQTATLAARHAGLWLAGAQLAVGVAQTAIVAWGIRTMIRAGAERAALAAAEAARAERRAAREERRATLAERRAIRAERRAERRHAETMRALEVLIARTAPERGANAARRRRIAERRRAAP